MKSPWQLGFLALVVTGVSTYDFVFFKNYRAQKQAPAQVETVQPSPGMTEPLLSPLPQSPGSEDAAIPSDTGLMPPISRDALQKFSQKAYVSNDHPEAGVEKNWPPKDPFSTHPVSERASHDAPSIPVKREMPAPQPPPAPDCVFSGTLIEGTRKLALVDGLPVAVGDRLGIWQLVRIEPDYIILEAGNNSHRIQLKGTELQIARRRDPSL